MVLLQRKLLKSNSDHMEHSFCIKAGLSLSFQNVNKQYVCLMGQPIELVSYATMMSKVGVDKPLRCLLKGILISTFSH